MMTDAELLSSYVQAGSEEAFASLVRRHVDAVYGATRRQVGDAALAEDVTQAAFILLARRAGKIRHPHLLAGWLMKTTRYCAADARKLARRRRLHEEKAATMRRDDEQTVEAAKIEIGEHLDVHLATLSDLDRTAIVLRCLEERSLAEVAAELKISEEAAKKRVARALEKLRKAFAREGATLSAGVLAVEIGKQVMTAPPGLASVCVAAGKGASVGAAALIAKGAVKLMTWTIAKTIGLAAIGVLMVVATAEAVHMLRPNEPVVEIASQPTTTVADDTAATEPEIATTPQFVYVMGKVSRPGVYQLEAGKTTSAKQMISAAQIFDSKTRSSGWVTIVRRDGPNSEHRITLPIQSLMQGVGVPAEAKVLQANDLIDVGVTAPDASVPSGTMAAASLQIIPADVPSHQGDGSTYGVQGQVSRTGRFSLNGEQITVKMAMAAADTPQPGRPLEKITVVLRRHVDGAADKVVSMNMAAVNEGREADRFLQPNDILEVKRR